MGWVYVLKNTDKRLDGLYKIGHTTKANPEDRAREITNGTGVIGKFKVEGVYQVYQSELVERHVHKILANNRYQHDREFFEVTLAEIDAAIRLAVTKTNDQLGPGTRAVVSEERRKLEEKRRSDAKRKADEEKKQRDLIKLNEDNTRKQRIAEENKRRISEELKYKALALAKAAEEKSKREARLKALDRKNSLVTTLHVVGLLFLFGIFFVKDAKVGFGLMCAFFIIGITAIIVEKFHDPT
jgi:hypothetical protein